MSLCQPVFLELDQKPLDYLFDACYKKIEFPSFQAIQTKDLWRVTTEQNMNECLLLLACNSFLNKKVN